MIKQTSITAAHRDLFLQMIPKMAAERVDMLAMLRAGVNDQVLMLEGVGGTCVVMVDGKVETCHAHKATAFTFKTAPSLQNGVGQKYRLVCRAHAISKGIDAVDAALAYMRDAASLPVEG